MTKETKNKPTPLHRFGKVLTRGDYYLRSQHLPRTSQLGLIVYRCKETSSVIINSERKFVGPGGIRVLNLLSNIYQNRDHRGQKFSLGLLRRTAKKIRTIDINNEGCKGVRLLLNLLIEHTYLDDRRRLLIWLRGRLGGRSGTEVIALYSDHPDWRMRKDVARTLKRLQAWAELRNLHKQEVHPKVRHIARQLAMRSFDDRLGAFCQSVKPRKFASSSSRSLFVDESVSFMATLPRPLKMLRQLLQQISISVSGARKRG